MTRQAIQEGKRLRPYYLGDYYPLTEMSADATSWAAYEYLRPEPGDGFAAFFRRPDSSQSSMQTHLLGIEPGKSYRVTWYWDYEAARIEVPKGSEPRRFTASIPERPGSLLIQFQRTS